MLTLKDDSAGPNHEIAKLDAANGLGLAAVSVRRLLTQPAREYGFMAWMVEAELNNSNYLCLFKVRVFSYRTFKGR